MAVESEHGGGQTVGQERRGGGRRAAQREATRNALIAAGRECFSERGFAATRIEDIAVRAGAATATFYLHFPTKRDLLLEFVAEVRDDGATHYDRLDAVVAARSLEAIRDWLEWTYRRWPAMAPLVRFIEQAAASDPVIESGYSDLFTRGRDTIALALERLGTGRDEALRRATLVMSLHHGLFAAFRAGSLPRPEDIIDGTAAVWWTALFD